MDGRRMTTSPRPCNGRRRVAKNAGVNSVLKLQRREICSKRCCAFSLRMSDAQERFTNFRLQEEYVADREENSLFHRRRTEIMQIVAVGDMVFALTQYGRCDVFSRETNQRICFLNVNRDQFIRRLFYNKNDHSIITLSVVIGNFCSLKCKSTKIELIQQGQPLSGVFVFESGSLKEPSTVEFDSDNEKVLTYSVFDSIYKVFDLKSYKLLYTISDRNIQWIKCSPVILLLAYHRAKTNVTLEILSIEDGTLLRSFKHSLHRYKHIEFIELLNEKILIKQKDKNLEILDVQTSDLKEVSKTNFTTPSAFIFLRRRRLFLTLLRNGTIAVWNLHGELVTSFDDPLVRSSKNSLYVTNDQDLIISARKANSAYHSTGINEDSVSINFNNILTGECVSKITTNNAVPLEEHACGKSLASEALQNITSIFYNEERNEIYTGNIYGLIHIWSV